MTFHTEETRMSRLAGGLATGALVLLVAGCGGGPGGGTGAGGAGSGAASAGTPGATTDCSEAAGTPADSAAYFACRLMSAEGGRAAWKRTRYLAFHWIVDQGGQAVADRAHRWDRRTGRYRLSFTPRDGKPFLALFDFESMRSDTTPPEGDVWVGGRKLDGAARDSALHRAYAIAINDSYWLLMPLKWDDPGVHLAYEGRTTLSDSTSYPTVHLTFESGLGVTNDEYWAFLDPESGRMAAWRYHLQGQEEKGPLIWWKGWRAFGPQGLELATDRRVEGGGMRIHFEGVVADTAVPDTAFAAPE
ncbi:MAG TPA: hypothetical protein VKB18_06610 [Gemmatimonadota bacterium]|nr:hypothetical protein [Gemmatimonadota bacterium]